MTDFDDERDDAAVDEEELRSPPRQANRPLLLAGIGLALMLGGYAASTYTPPLRQDDSARRLQELRQMAQERESEGVNDALVDRLNHAAVSRQPAPPYQLAGRLAIYAGLFLFVMAGVLMYRSKPAPRKDADEFE